MPLVYIAYGSNQGEKQKNIESGLLHIEKKGLGKILRKSPVYESEPVNCKSRENFYNGAFELMTELSPQDLLKALMAIEKEFGRDHSVGKNQPRTIDLDILAYDFNVLNETNLTIPHPEMANRHFVLKPLADIKPGLYHPVLKKTIQELLDHAPPAVLAQKIQPL